MSGERILVVDDDVSYAGRYARSVKSGVSTFLRRRPAVTVFEWRKARRRISCSLTFECRT